MIYNQILTIKISTLTHYFLPQFLTLSPDEGAQRQCIEASYEECIIYLCKFFVNYVKKKNN